MNIQVRTTNNGAFWTQLCMDMGFQAFLLYWRPTLLWEERKMFWANQLHCTNVFMKSSAISLYQPSRAAKQITFSLKTFSGSRSWWLSAGKESAYNAGDRSWIPGSGRSPREGLATHSSILGLPWWLRWWRIRLQCRRPGFDPWVGKTPLEKGTATHSSILAWGEVHGLCSKESDTTERLSLTLGPH